MNETKIRTGTFKYVNTLQTGEVCGIDMTVGDVKYAVPIDEGNTEYIIIKRLADAGTISIAAAD